MPLISGTIPNLINGVSQQPQTTRNPSQAQEQLNFLSTASKGLRRRPGSQLIAVPSVGLPVTNPDDYAAHVFKRTETEQYHVLIYGVTGAVRITNLQTGVVVSTSDAYFVTTNARKFLRFLTVADFTFILNTERVVAPSPLNTAPLDAPTANTSPRLSDVYAVVASGQYGKTYSVTITLQSGVSFTGSYTTPNGGSAGDAPAISTDNIAEQLRVSLLAAVPAPLAAQISVRRYGYVVNVFTTPAVTPDNRIRSFKLEDGFGGNALRGFNQITDDFSRLPSLGSNESPPIKVVEGASRDNLGYYVRFEGNGDGETGSWRETVSLYADPDASHKNPSSTTQRLSRGFDPATMPRALVNSGVNIFSVTVPAWGNRSVGDSLSAKDPSFVGKTIRNMFFHRNRLGFLTVDAVSLSEANSFFNFYPTTVIQVLDTDRIDVKANSTLVDDFHGATSFDRDLFVFGSRTQYRLVGEPLLTPKTAEMKLVTSFDSNPQLAPITVGSRIYFSSLRGVYSSFREMYLTNDSVLDAPLISAQSPEYVPAEVRHMAASTSDDLLAVCPVGEDALYVYAYYFQGAEKLMGGWSRWEFKRADGTMLQPLHAEFLNSRLILTMRTASLISIVELDVALSDNGNLGPYRVSCIDFGLDYTPAVMELDGIGSTLIEPIGLVITDNVRAVIVDADEPEAGQEVPVVYDAGLNRYVLTGDLTAYQAVRIGLRIDSEYTFSDFYARRPSAGGGTITDTLSRLSIRRVEVVYENGTQFRSEVTPQARPTHTHLEPSNAAVVYAGYEGRYPYVPSAGLFRFGVNTKNTGTVIKLVSNSVHPVDFLSATWEAQIIRHSKAT